jgi:RNA polymerase sigma factor (sigma-70 family)
MVNMYPTRIRRTEGSFFDTVYLAFPATAPITTQSLGSGFATTAHAPLCREHVNGKPFVRIFDVVKSLIRQASCRGKERHGRVRAHMHTRTDAELLNDYVSTGDEAAFGELVTRHGAFVHRTCLRLLKDAHEAEDACQAVFLVLARKARRLRGGDLSAWLYRVGQLVATETARKRMRRAQREERYAADEPGSGEAPVLEETDRQAVLDAVDAELMALSGANREAVLLRYLRGHSQEEAARLAGCSVSALSVRASRGIEAIRRRLVTRGIVLGAPVLAAALESEAQAAIPETVLASTMAAVKAYAAGTAATAAVSANVTALTKGACNMLFWSSVKTAAVAVAASVAVIGGGAIMAQQVAQRKGADSGEVILRAAEIPISIKDTKGEIYVAVPKQYLDEGNPQPQMWGFNTGMTDFYRRVFRLTEKEQRQLQVLLEEAWSGADVLERCFTVTQDAQSVTAELRDADAVRLLEETELRIQTNFLHKAAGVLGPGRAEVMNWFSARHRGIVPWPLSANPGPGTTRYSMKLSRVSGVSSGVIRFEIDTEGAPDDSSWAGALSSGDGKAAARCHLGDVSSQTPWPALGARLGVSREAALGRARADRARYTQQMSAVEPFRTTDSPLAPPPIGFESESGDMRGVYVVMSLAVRSNPLHWLTHWRPGEPVSTSAAWCADTPTDRYRLNPAWVQVLRLRSVPEDQSQLMVGIFQRTLAAMNEACAEGLTVTHKSDDRVVCVVRADALAKFPEILDRQHREIKTALGSEEKAEIVRAVVAHCAPIPGHAAEQLWNLRTVSKEDMQFVVEKDKQSSPSGDVLYSVQMSAPKFGFGWGGQRIPREHLPPFLAALLPAK